MLLNAKTPHIALFKIHDCTGALISFTHSYNTDTKEVAIYLPAIRPVEGQAQRAQTLVHQPSKFNEAGEIEEAAPVLVTFTLSGSYATFDGKIVEDNFVLPAEEPKIEHESLEAVVEAAPEAEMEIVEEKCEDCNCPCETKEDKFA